MKAQDIMTRNPEAVTPSDPISLAAEIMERLDVGAIPVVEDRRSMRLKGVITDRDIAVRHVAHHHRDDCPVSAHMTAERLSTTRPDADVHDVLEHMKRDRVRRIPVTEDGGRLIGIIAQADVARKLGPAEPEAVEEVLERVSEPTHRA